MNLALCVFGRLKALPALCVLLVAGCGCCADSPELQYTRALVRETQLVDAVRSLRAAVSYAEMAGLETRGTAAALSEAEAGLATITAQLQADQERPDIQQMDHDALSAATEHALGQATAALDALRAMPALRPRTAPTRGFLPLPSLNHPITGQIVFAALAPTQPWPGWSEGSRAWDVLRALDLQALSPWFGWYWPAGATGDWAQDPGRIQQVLERLEGLGFPALLWLEPQFNVGHLWDEIGQELYLHDSSGQWRERTRINNTINVFHPRVREEVCGWLRQLARAQRGDPRIIGYELVEEPALRFDISEPGSAHIEPRLGGYSKAAVSAFRKRLEGRYGSIAQLNRDWASSYAAFEDIHPPTELSRARGSWQGAEVALLAGFQEFRAAEHAEYFRQMVAALHEGDPDALVIPQFTTSLFGDPLGGVDLFGMSRAGWDLVTFHTDTALAYMQSVARYAGKPLWNDEYIWSGRVPRLATGEKRLRAHAAINLWQNLMWGARGFVVFNLDFTWQHAKDGGDWNNDLLNENLADKAPRYAAAAFAQVLRKAQALFDELSSSVVEDEGLMILEPTTSVYTTVPTGTCQWWATRLAVELGQAHYRPAFCPERYLLDGTENLRAYRALVVPVGTYMPEEVCRRLWEWVQAGGTLIALGPSATHDNHGKPRSSTAPLGGERPGQTLAAGAGQVVSIAFRGTPEEILARARQAVDAAIGPRAAIASDPRVELMLRRLPGGESLLILLNTDPDESIRGQATVAGNFATVLDLTVEYGITVPCPAAAGAVRLPFALDPGEARAFLLGSVAPQG